MDNIHSFLLKIGVPASHKGFDYLHDGIQLLMQDNQYKWNTIGLYEKLADVYNIKWNNIERCIRTSIDHCFKKTSANDLSLIFGKKNVSKGKITNSEFMAISALYLK